MTYECVACANFFNGPKPSRCPECGSRKLISQDAPRLTKTSTTTDAEIVLWRLRQGA